VIAYPNPFNGQTTLNVSIPEEMHVKLEIINVLNQPVQTLINEILEKGDHARTFKTDTKGLYLYRIITPKGSFSGKIVNQ